MGGHRMLVSILKSWLVIHVRGEKFLSSVITFKVFDLERRSTAQIEAHKKSFQRALIFCIFNFRNQRYKAQKLVLMLKK